MAQWLGMIPWVQLDTAKMPGANGELRLMQRGAEYSIMLGAIELMNSRMGSSEEALATLACQRIAERPAPRVLIGGLGLGFTLRAALGVLGDKAKVVVAELVPSVVAWAKGPLAEIHGASLADPRVSIRETDVGLSIRSAESEYDAILLDVDNGPQGLSVKSNDYLYRLEGLAAVRRALKVGGVLGVWSSAPDDNFTHRLRRTGFKVEETRVKARVSRGGRRVIWLATNPGGQAGPF